jgi:Ca2+-transporting ATPase
VDQHLVADGTLARTEQALPAAPSHHHEADVVLCRDGRDGVSGLAGLHQSVRDHRGQLILEPRQIGERAPLELPGSPNSIQFEPGHFAEGLDDVDEPQLCVELSSADRRRHRVGAGTWAKIDRSERPFPRPAAIGPFRSTLDRRHGEHWKRRSAQHAVRRRAKHHPVGAGRAMRPDDNEVAFQPFRGPRDLLVRPSNRDIERDRINRHAEGTDCLLNEAPERTPAFLNQQFLVVGHCRSRDEQRILHEDDDKLSPEALDEHRGVAQSLSGVFREIDGAENGSKESSLGHMRHNGASHGPAANWQIAGEKRTIADLEWGIISDDANFFTVDARRFMSSWHNQTVEEVIQDLSTDRSGLAEDEAQRRLARVGPNRLSPAKPISALRILRDQFRSVVVYLLVAAAGISFSLGDRIESIAIAAVLVISTAIGFVTEFRARRAMEALLQFDVAKATVFRAGQLRTVDAATIVPGDIVQLDIGRRVPADARLVETTDFRTDEAALTGESLPVPKGADQQFDEGTPLADRTNMIYKGTTAVAGTAVAVVTETGASTEIGRIGTLVGTIEEKRTPLERHLDALGRRLVWLALGIAALVAGLGAWQGAPLGLVVEMGIALAVAAVPEALPAVATIALAVGVHRMARRRALVRRLPAVEALGSATVICTDKTRTLTSGLMTLVRLWTAERDFALRDEALDHAALKTALEAGALASRPQPRGDGDQAALGDPVDLALLAAAERAGISRSLLVQQRPLEGMVPFSSDRKFMAAFHREQSGLVAYAKGAPRRILEMSQSMLGEQGAQPLDDAQRRKVLEANDAMASEGLRVLALAFGQVASATEAAVEGLTFAGLVGFADPPAEGVKEAIARLRSAGLRTIMLTGDQRATAAAVGRELNLLTEGQAIIDGRELDALSDDDLNAKLPNIAAFSRITPQHKLRLVQALQARGEIVAMLGDGVNDAPALRKADVGVAMGIRGTDVAKEAAAIVLQDDRFETVTAAVEEGRVIFDNIRKFVFYLFSCNVAEVLVLLCAALAGLPMPLMPLQILWLNMVTDTFPALALALEPGDADVMRRPPRDPAEVLLSRPFLTSVMAYGALITGATLGAFLLYSDGPVRHAQTVAFQTLAFAQLFHLGNARREAAVLSLKQALSNPYALAALALSVVLQVIAVYVGPLARVLGTVPLEGRDWLIVLGFAAIPAVVGQMIKLTRRDGRMRSHAPV